MIPGPTNLWSAFEQTVRRRGSAPALDFGSGGIVSFDELHHDAERSAGWLQQAGIARESIVALQLPKRRETYALWLACLRRGHPYVFVDPRNPPQRTGQIVSRLRPGLCVSIFEAANPHGATLTLGDAAAGERWLGDLPPRASEKPANVQGLHPAYVMFTSGSTGEPKGAVIPQQGVLSLMRWGASICEPDASRFSNINPLHFDNSVFDLYCGLLNGATLVPVETTSTLNPAHWVKQLREREATVIFAVPTFFQTLDQLNLLKPQNLPFVKLFIFGGEGYPITALKTFHDRFQGQAQLLNVYGPTETSCICSSQPITAAELEGTNVFPSLGHMHEGFSHAILDEEGRDVPQGEVGELWIGGQNVGLGYFANEQETARRFCQDPRHDSYRSIWYRSGDLVLSDDTGRLWFRGRADNQVKIRGHRIELEEIDLAVEALEDVSRAVAAVVASPQGTEIRVAFVASREVSLDRVRAHCSATLPPYMQPARVVQLDVLPKNANGKVDRLATRGILEGLA